VPVLRSAVRETTALGAGYLAGLGVGFWDRPNDIESLWQADETFHPAMSDDRREHLYGDWRRAVNRSRNWAS
jgi:glycerol kinase